MIKTVIFDLDGVIVTTDELHYQAWKHMADFEGIYFDKIINNRLRGVSRMKSLDIILEKSSKDYSNEEKNKLASFKNQYYVELLKQLSPLDILPGVIEVLEELKKRGVLIAIGSSSKNAKIILNQIKLNNIFDAIVDGNDIMFSKPSPEVFEKAAERLNVHPSSCAVVEDAEAGIIAAKNAGMTAIAVSDARKSQLADYRLNDIKEILDIII